MVPLSKLIISLKFKFVWLTEVMLELQSSSSREDSDRKLL